MFRTLVRNVRQRRHNVGDVRRVISGRKGLFELLPIRTGCTVLLGDSLIANGEWHELLGPDYLNRGIGGDTCEGVLSRLDHVIALEPSRVLLLIGTNDLGLFPEEKIAEDISEIVWELVHQTNADVGVYGLLPSRSAKRNQKALAVNKRLISEQPSRYLDLWPCLADAEGMLARDYSQDGLHLSGDAYIAWADDIRRGVQSARSTPCKTRSASASGQQ